MTVELVEAKRRRTDLHRHTQSVAPARLRIPLTYLCRIRRDVLTNQLTVRLKATIGDDDSLCRNPLATLKHDTDHGASLNKEAGYPRAPA